MMGLEMDSKVSELVDLKPFRASEDKKGHSVTMGAKVPSWFDRGITKLVEDKATPYEVKSDVIRDATWLGLQVLKLRYNQPEWDAKAELVKLEAALQDEDDDKEQDRSFLDNLDRLWRKDKAKTAEMTASYVRAVIASTSKNGYDERAKELLNSSLIKEILSWRKKYATPK